mmetsp:Transcript_10357/g.32873  ORF Transcript_10357/g.32873 Transcript_10357/m.32873 type:complete len:327 (+) Transcript_10357:664-1644(+)
MIQRGHRQPGTGLYVRSVSASVLVGQCCLLQAMIARFTGRSTPSRCPSTPPPYGQPVPLAPHLVAASSACCPTPPLMALAAASPSSPDMQTPAAQHKPHSAAISAAAKPMATPSFSTAPASTSPDAAIAWPLSMAPLPNLSARSFMHCAKHSVACFVMEAGISAPGGNSLPAGGDSASDTPHPPGSDLAPPGSSGTPHFLGQSAACNGSDFEHSATQGICGVGTEDRSTALGTGLSAPAATLLVASLALFTASSPLVSASTAAAPGPPSFLAAASPSSMPFLAASNPALAAAAPAVSSPLPLPSPPLSLPLPPPLPPPPPPPPPKP